MSKRESEFYNLIHTFWGTKQLVAILVLFGFLLIPCDSYKYSIDPMVFGITLIVSLGIISLVCYSNRERAKYYLIILCIRIFVMMVGALPQLSINSGYADSLWYVLASILFLFIFWLNIRIQQKDWDNKFQFLTTNGKINLRKKLFFISRNILYSRKGNKESKLLIVGNFFVPLVTFILFRFMMAGGPKLEVIFLKTSALIWFLTMDYAFAVNVFMLYKIAEYEKKANCEFVTEFQTK